MKSRIAISQLEAELQLLESSKNLFEKAAELVKENIVVEAYILGMPTLQTCLSLFDIESTLDDTEAQIRLVTQQAVLAEVKFLLDNIDYSDRENVAELKTSLKLFLTSPDVFLSNPSFSLQVAKLFEDSQRRDEQFLAERDEQARQDANLRRWNATAIHQNKDTFPNFKAKSVKSLDQFMRENRQEFDDALKVHQIKQHASTPQWQAHLAGIRQFDAQALRKHGLFAKNNTTSQHAVTLDQVEKVQPKV